MSTCVWAPPPVFVHSSIVHWTLTHPPIHPTTQFGPSDDLTEVILKGGEPRAPWTGYLLRTLPPPWNVDAVLQVWALRGGALEKEAARQEARARLLEWYRAEIAG